ncbi:hypothetical protein LCGC14_0338460 [marine sediment metagenome]|uniref:Uncharacterized protein n=1 Tax=marine sediment metagenome TaxID=412755 RepID=A0A0F9TXF7_9ZZZZ
MRLMLRNAGYREKVFFKARLAQLGRVDQFKHYLNHAYYDPKNDRIVADNPVWSPVRWEGSESRRILGEHGLDDSDC